MKKRQIVKIIEEICNEKGYKLSLFSDEWLIVVNNGKKNMFIHCYRFPNNDAAVADLCNDKSALSEYLTSYNIDCIPHSYYFITSEKDFLSLPDELSEVISAYIDKYGAVVIKPNKGTGGTNVHKISDKKEIEDCLRKYFRVNDMIAISPYVEIEAEYRTVICGDEIMLTFEKIRPFVIADGVKSYTEYLKEANIQPFDNLTDYIPKYGEKILLSWKHNLQRGAKPMLVEKPQPEIVNLVKKVQQVMDIKFASIDIVKVQSKYYILEINSGVMMEKFSSSNETYYNLAKKAYEKSINDYFSD